MTPYRIFLFAAFLAVFVWAAINPLFPHDWLLENYLVFIFVPFIFIVSRYLKLSDVSYTLITIFFILHVIGSHYTYAEVPFGDVLQDWFGASRNMYDRLVHFSFGFLLAYPIREVFIRLSGAKGFWGFYFPFDVTLAFSAAYEIIEWLTAATVDPAAGLAFLGSQGDVWDAQKDMLLAGVGAAIAMAIIFIINLFLNSGFWKEFKGSFRIPKNDEPLGEVRLQRFLKKRGFSQLAVLLILAALAGVGYFEYQYLRPTKMCWPYCPEMTDADREKIKESAREAETANWQTYRNEKYEFEFKSPARRVELFPASSADYLSGDREFYGIYGVSNQDYAARVDVYPGTLLSTVLQSNQFVNTLGVSGNATMNGIIWTRVGDTDYLVEKRNTTYHLSGYQDLITPILSTFRFTK